MRIETVWTTEADSARAAREAADELALRLGGPPSLVIVYTTVTHDHDALVGALRARLPDVPLHGGSSCLGVMSRDGFHSSAGTGLGLLGIRDPEGDYGVGAAEIGDDARAAGSAAIERAIAAVERDGEPPDFVWIAGVPGHEERLIQGVQDVLGTGVPIAGGSTADNDVSGRWLQIAGATVSRNSVVVTAMYPSTEVHVAFHSGYSPTARTGVATRASGRVLHELDGRPAARVYNEWTGGVLDDHLAGGGVLGLTTLHPLGREVGEVGGLPYHRLSHPDAVTPDGGLSLFTDVAEGERLTLMTGTRDSLVTRAGRVARTALGAGQLDPGDIAGALVVYCAGCMLTVQDDMARVADVIAEALGEAPFLGTFTFGEQGCFVGGENHHGNLMISVVVFQRDDEAAG
ncbi:MAG: FIST C-terminal domain-containing protein [Myxococcales bacterium]|nr:FIST C-terminal domain-containing protein [Myxococcales bacterium]